MLWVDSLALLPLYDNNNKSNNYKIIKKMTQLSYENTFGPFVGRTIESITVIFNRSQCNLQSIYCLNGEKKCF